MEKFKNDMKSIKAALKIKYKTVLEQKIKDLEKEVESYKDYNINLVESLCMLQNLTIKLAETMNLDWMNLNPSDIFKEAEKRLK